MKLCVSVVGTDPSLKLTSNLPCSSLNTSRSMSSLSDLAAASNRSSWEDIVIGADDWCQCIDCVLGLAPSAILLRLCVGRGFGRCWRGLRRRNREMWRKTLPEFDSPIMGLHLGLSTRPGFMSADSLRVTYHKDALSRPYYSPW